MPITDIFTRQPGVDGSLEHLLPAALGGTLASRALIGSETNNLFGRTLDPALVEPFQLLQNALELRSRRGKTAGYTIDPISGSYRLGSGMRPEVRKTGFTEVIDEEKSVIHITARNREEAIHFIEAVRKKYGETLDLSTATITSHSEYVEDPFHLQISLGGPCQLRAIGKCAFEAAALALGSEVILSSVFDSIRSWIYNGALEFELISASNCNEPVSFCRHDYRDEIWKDLPTDAEHPFSHRIFVFAESGGGVWAALELFGHFRFSINLSERHDSDNFSWAVLMDPISRKHRCLEPAPSPPISALNFRSFMETDTSPVRDAWNHILEKVKALQSERLINHMVVSAVEECLPDCGETLLPEHIDELANHIAEAYVSFAMRISSSEELTLADFPEISHESDSAC